MTTIQFFSKKTINDLEISCNENGWGPVSGDRLVASVFGEIPYAHFDKKEKIGRHSDFISTNQYVYKQQRSRRDDYNINTEFAYKHDAVEDSTFQLVDSTAKTSKRKILCCIFTVMI